MALLAPVSVVMVAPQNAFAGAFPGLDARLGRHGAVPESIGLVAGFHDVVAGEPIQQSGGYISVAKHRRPLRETQVGGDHHTDMPVQIGESSEPARRRRPD